MFMQIAIGAIGIGIVLMVGYLVIAQVSTQITAGFNANESLRTASENATVASIQSTQATVFAGFALIAVGIIVLAAFGLINIFK